MILLVPQTKAGKPTITLVSDDADSFERNGTLPE
jgi:hypothetical protein